MAIEDAVALAIVLSPDTTLDEVPDRLQLYEKIRFVRGHAIQEFSRQAGADYVDGKPQIDSLFAFFPIICSTNINSDEIRALQLWS